MEETTTTLRHTALTSTHIALGAKMVPFAGYSMPVQYAGLMEEHHAVRTNVGVFDVSHMGEFWVTGPKAFELIQYITSNDVSKLFDGKVQYSCLPNGKGGIVDDLLVYRVNSEKYLLVVNAGNIEKDWNWIEDHNKNIGADLHDASGGTSLLAVQGPRALQVLQRLTPMDLSSMEYYTFKTGTFAGEDSILISATGYTGAGGFEIYFPNEVADKMWKAIFDAGRTEGIVPVGLGARDTLRLEMGFCLYGNDIDDTTSPLEAGLGWITKFTKEFVDGDRLKAQKAEGVKRKLCGFEMVDKGIPRHGYPITDAAGNELGVVTSGTQSPSLSKAIGLGYVPVGLAAQGSEIFVSIRGKLLKAVITPLPFYKAS
jgi:aminomethyltransferase